jgi:hypothetical protein
MTITCPYCQQPAMLVDGSVIYPHRSDLATKHFWYCADDEAWVGCHRDTTKPLGRLADAELRQAKQDAHVAFDQLWRATTPAGSFDRSGAYAWLAQELGIRREDCHIGMFDVAQCQRVVEVCGKRIVREGRK